MSFPIAKLLIVSGPEAGGGDGSGLTWLGVGVYGQTALFRGRALVKQWSASGSADGGDLLVDALLLSGPDKEQHGAATVGLVFQDAIRRVELQL